MRKTTKAWLIVAFSLLLLGVLLFGGVMMALNWDFHKLSTNRFDQREHEIREDFNNISIDTDTADITFLPSADGSCSVVCYEQEKVGHSVTVKDHSLVIEVVDTRRWYEHIGISFGSPRITVYLPKAEYGALVIRSSTGKIEVPSNFCFESMDLSQSTGDVRNAASASGTVRIKTTTGNISVENVSAEAMELSVSTGRITASGVRCAGALQIAVSTGKAILSGVECGSLTSTGNTGDLTLQNVIAAQTLSVKRSTGDVRLESCDAAEIFVTTDTGDVTGSLRSEKAFLVKTDTGRVSVPSSTTGGRCEITTDTGEIKITVQ